MKITSQNSIIADEAKGSYFWKGIGQSEIQVKIRSKKRKKLRISPSFAILSFLFWMQEAQAEKKNRKSSMIENGKGKTGERSNSLTRKNQANFHKIWEFAWASRYTWLKRNTENQKPAVSFSPLFQQIQALIFESLHHWGLLITICFLSVLLTRTMKQFDSFNSEVGVSDRFICAPSSFES